MPAHTRLESGEMLTSGGQAISPGSDRGIGVVAVCGTS